ncbi:MAG: ferrous iron transport protein A [Phycisphaerae bacterium]
MSLASAPMRRVFLVKGVRPGNPLSHRLMEMGLIEGTEVQVIGRAPLGDPLQIRLGDYELSLRSSEADLVEVDAL